MWSGLAAAVVAVVLPVPARAAPGCPAPSLVAPIVAGTPAELLSYVPERLGLLATGAGVRVAVLDSGVDAAHPQLAGRVVAGRDLLRGDSDGRLDCAGHGTAVASVIAAGPDPRTGFRGLAPGVTIVPVRVSEPARVSTAAEFAEAIAWAAGPGRAAVINISLVMTADAPAVRRAVTDAVGAGVVIVAAVGNAALHGNPTPYPAAYPGVIGVGAVTRAGGRAGYSQRGPFVDIVAFGNGITAAAPGGGHRTAQGTSFAVPFVAATVALLRQRFPSAGPAEISRRLLAAADPAPGGEFTADYGHGLLNPYRALTESPGLRPAREERAAEGLTEEERARVERARSEPARKEQADAERAREALAAARSSPPRAGDARERALRFAGIALSVAMALGLLAAATARAHRRGWRPGP